VKVTILDDSGHTTTDRS